MLTLKELIKNQTDEDLFLFHIAVNIIGNWKGDGWSDVIDFIGERI